MDTTLKRVVHKKPELEKELAGSRSYKSASTGSPPPKKKERRKLPVRKK